MKIDLNENDMLLATILVLAGAIAAIALKQMDIINAGAQYQTPQYSALEYKVPILSTPSQTTQMIEPPQYDEPTIIVDATPVDMPETSPVVYRSPVTFMGYNSSDDLVSIARRLPNGEIVRRKIRDPELELSELEVTNWVEFNEYNKESNMTWV